MEAIEFEEEFLIGREFQCDTMEVKIGPDSIEDTRLGLKCQTSVKVQPKILVKKNFEKKFGFKSFSPLNFIELKNLKSKKS